jgi:hypothetical protein
MAAAILAGQLIIRCLTGCAAGTGNGIIAAEIACEVYSYQQQARYACCQVFEVHDISPLLSPLPSQWGHPVFVKLFLIIVHWKN